MRRIFIRIHGAPQSSVYLIKDDATWSDVCMDVRTRLDEFGFSNLSVPAEGLSALYAMHGQSESVFAPSAVASATVKEDEIVKFMFSSSPTLQSLDAARPQGQLPVPRSLEPESLPSEKSTKLYVWANIENLVSQLLVLASHIENSSHPHCLLLIVCSTVEAFALSRVLMRLQVRAASVNTVAEVSDLSFLSSVHRVLCIPSCWISSAVSAQFPTVVFLSREIRLQICGNPDFADIEERCALMHFEFLDEHSSASKLETFAAGRSPLSISVLRRVPSQGNVHACLLAPWQESVIREITTFHFSLCAWLTEQSLSLDLLSKNCGARLWEELCHHAEKCAILFFQRPDFARVFRVLRILSHLMRIVNESNALVTLNFLDAMKRKCDSEFPSGTDDGDKICRWLSSVFTALVHALESVPHSQPPSPRCELLAKFAAEYMSSHPKEYVLLVLSSSAVSQYLSFAFPGVLSPSSRLIHFVSAYPIVSDGSLTREQLQCHTIIRFDCLGPASVLDSIPCLDRVSDAKTVILESHIHDVHQREESLKARILQHTSPIPSLYDASLLVSSSPSSVKRRKRDLEDAQPPAPAASLQQATQEPSEHALASAKTNLYLYLNKYNLPMPKYEVVESFGPAHKKRFRVRVMHGEHDFVCEGSSVKNAERRGAHSLLEAFYGAASSAPLTTLSVELKHQYTAPPS
ncbi:mitochondrial C-terminal double-stranded RNA binding motif (DSRM)-containing protein [Andalucia godoyi]|uniref:Mitochondrial C-terminal double-stranded RNA binding motif (DSRM)-containing protein n=1 Tax=Andalucia godoyi TaxID=505711 RepID=A0A8K0AHH4_ANDGO|nr:mitochondrial C-terminal double-stranded RNA binding motif (DSRM)-containing protein [Andalucia godoyi]|eukprot:ANDGO_05166.mRNA.1 mitochondrial C-terminal double-stranded RNA binding motif (DSRM)-containing protein